MGVLADQPDNVAAFARRGLGRPLELTAKRGEIADAMTSLLGNSCYAAAMTAVGTELSQLLPLDITQLLDSA
ncbi:hypothetical protein [Streptomyces sp. AV19]|uniref:hypothetical protein n=1 Tax=Streptomyces sp. AV19 TaxID=2793068 RepID=UPI001F358D35|nr:hypothetical protein [Streptomyces sp. AV19]MDG4533735.1 hypothetical protein [Streptomyces sp. AV19]